MVKLTLRWKEPESFEIVDIIRIVNIRPGPNFSLIISVIDAENEQVEYYCDEINFQEERTE